MPNPIRTRPVGWPVIALFVALATGLLPLLLVVRHVRGINAVLAGVMWRENLFIFAALLVVVVAGVIFGLGRLRSADVGLRRDGIVQGVVVAAIVWALMQLAGVVSAIAPGEPVVLARGWTGDAVGGTLAWAAAMFLGAALYEEISYRGFLFPQLYLKLSGSHRARFWTALIASQVLFATSHIPAHVAIRQLAGAALWLTVVLQGVVGALLLLLYLRTRNLWIPVGIHGIANAPTPLVAGAWGWEMLLIVLVIAWPWLARNPGHRSLGRVEPADAAGVASLVPPP